MPWSGFGSLGRVVLVAVVIAGTLRWFLLAAQERQAWGIGRAGLARAQRRSIRRAVARGQAVGDPALAGPAVRFGVAVVVSTKSWRLWGDTLPLWILIIGRVFFPLLGAFAVWSGWTGRDVTELVSGVVLLGFTVLYLPVTMRRMLARRTERDRRVLQAIEVNRRLASAA